MYPKLNQTKHCSRCNSKSLVEDGRGTDYWVCLSCGQTHESREHDALEDMGHDMISGASSTTSADANRFILAQNKIARFEGAAARMDYINRKGFYPVLPRVEEKHDKNG